MIFINTHRQVALSSIWFLFVQGQSIQQIEHENWTSTLHGGHLWKMINRYHSKGQHVSLAHEDDLCCSIQENIQIGKKEIMLFLFLKPLSRVLRNYPNNCRDKLKLNSTHVLYRFYLGMSTDMARLRCEVYGTLFNPIIFHIPQGLTCQQFK